MAVPHGLVLKWAAGGSRLLSVRPVRVCPQVPQVHGRPLPPLTWPTVAGNANGLGLCAVVYVEVDNTRQTLATIHTGERRRHAHHLAAHSVVGCERVTGWSPSQHLPGWNQGCWWGGGAQPWRWGKQLAVPPWTCLLISFATPAGEESSPGSSPNPSPSPRTVAIRPTK